MKFAVEQDTLIFGGNAFQYNSNNLSKLEGGKGDRTDSGNSLTETITETIDTINTNKYDTSQKFHAPSSGSAGYFC